MSTMHCAATPHVVITQPFTDTVKCPGTALSIPFNIAGVYNTGNMFTAQLLDSTGSFSSAVDIGSFTSVSAGSISGTIPTSMLSGTSYRIRIVSSLPADTSADDGVNIHIKQRPVIDSVFADSPGYVCDGSSLALHAIADTVYHYQWLISGVGIPGATTPSRQMGDSGYYSVRVTNAAGCYATSSAIYLTVAKVVKPVITMLDIVLCAQPGYKSYHWFRNNQPTGDTGSCMTMADYGVYSVTVISDSGCSATSGSFYLSGYAVPGVNGVQRVRVYPNPSSNIVTIEAAEPVNIILTSADGQEIIHKDNVRRVDISKLPQQFIY